MTESSIRDQIDENINEVIEKKILRHTIQFFKKGKERLEPFGSGVFVKIYNDYFIFTASHVADFFEKNNKKNLHIRIAKKSYINVLGEIQYTIIEKSKGIDLAYIKLDEQMIEPLCRPYFPLSITNIRSHNKKSNETKYCVCGYPEKNISKKSEPLETGASVYLTNASKENTYEYYKYNPKDTFIVDMKGKGTDLKTKEIIKIDTEFYGISGCGLWFLTNIINESNGKTEIDYKLIGIMTEFKKGKYFCLVSNKIYLIIEALKVIEKYEFIEKRV